MIHGYEKSRLFFPFFFCHTRCRFNGLSLSMQSGICRKRTESQTACCLFCAMNPSDTTINNKQCKSCCSPSRFMANKSSFTCNVGVPVPLKDFLIVFDIFTGSRNMFAVAAVKSGQAFKDVLHLNELCLPCWPQRGNHHSSFCSPAVSYQLWQPALSSLHLPVARC